MELPNVKNVNKDKRKLKKHHFKVKDMVAYKWYAEKEVGYIMECYHSKDGWACYKIKSASKPGCIYSDMQLDDPEDPYCYISSVLTKSMTDGERELVKKRIEWSESLRRQRIYTTFIGPCSRLCRRFKKNLYQYPTWAY